MNPSQSVGNLVAALVTVEKLGNGAIYPPLYRVALAGVRLFDGNLPHVEREAQALREALVAAIDSESTEGESSDQ